MRRVTLVGVVLLSACASAGNLSSQPPAPNAHGHLVIVGGGPIPEAVDRRFFELAGGAGTARIVVLPMASESGAESGAEKAASFQKLGAAHAVSLNLQRKDTGADSVARLLARRPESFPGGDQNRLTAAILGTAVLDSIQSRYATAPSWAASANAVV
jgi:cyanophycinase-like exopeptidase